MQTVFNFVCDPPDLKITLSIFNKKLAHISIYKNDDILCSRKFLIANIEREEINDLVAMFCELFIQGRLREQSFQGELDGSEFIVESSKTSLRKVYSKLGLPIWTREN